MQPLEIVKKARDCTRPSGKIYIDKIVDEFEEFAGDRLYSNDNAIVCGVGFINKMAVTAIAIDKGANTKERVLRNFGSANPEGYRKSLRLMKQAEKFNRPIICFIDTAGAYCGIGAEERGQGQAIAENLMEMSALKVPIISIIVGEGGSGGALALACSDRVWIMENAIYSVISPEGCASILYKDKSKVDEAAKALKLTAKDLKELQIVEEIISEEDDFFKTLSQKIFLEFTKLTQKSKQELIADRYERFRKFGRN